MKSLLLIVLIVVGSFGAAVMSLRAAHVRVNLDFPIAAGSVAIVSGIAGLLPVIRGPKSDAGTMLQKAMAGTMLHVLVAGSLSIGLIALKPPEQRKVLVCWVFAAYWISLLTVVWRSRQMVIQASMITAGATAKNQVATEVN